MPKITIDLKNIKAAIFDMDGTMVDNSEYHKKAWKEFLKRKGVNLTDKEYNEKISGNNNPKILENIFGPIHTPEEIKIFGSQKEELYREMYAPHLKQVAGLNKIIKTLKKKGIKLGVATTSPALNRNFILDSLSLTKEFNVIMGDEHIINSKPHPEIYLRTANILKIKPAQCLVFEDSPTGVLSAKNAGMTIIGLLTYHTKKELNKADYIINDYTDLEFN